MTKQTDNYIAIDNAIIYHENCLTAFQKLPTNSIDLIATDPPYFLDGMGDDWSDTKLNDKTAKAGVIGSLPVGMKFDPAQGLRLQTFFGKVSTEALRVLKTHRQFIGFEIEKKYVDMSVKRLQKIEVHSISL
jgi:site-specific DNA-methyltransferase (adenine-specific)